MKPEQFDETLRTMLRRKPFLPFTVYLNNGERIDVDAASGVAFNNGAGGYIDSDGLITFFECEEVREIAPVAYEAAS